MKLAKIESVYRQNMLVNGDFNVNQRGQSSYTGEGYGLDMWKIRTSGTMTINSGYVSFVGNSFAQFIPVSNFETSDYTVVIKLLNEDARVYHFNSFTGDYVEITLPNDTKVKCSLQYVDSKYIMPIVWPLTGSAVNIEYIDMFKGAIAFDHRREDYATALMRCQQYLRAGYYIGSCIFSYSDGTKLFSFCYENMKSTVTAKLNINYYTDRGESHDTTNYSIDSVLNGRVTFTLNDTTANAIQNGSVRIYAELSCEP